MKYFIKTFGCQQNAADSERVEAALAARGMTKAKDYTDADYIVINTCMIRESAENRVYGLVNNLSKLKSAGRQRKPKIIVTGCMTGLAVRDKSGKFLRKIRKAMPVVDEFMPIEETGFDHQPLRQDKENAWIPISNGCNNFCTYCVVPFTRGREVSRPYEDIMTEAKELKAKGYKNITLLGQNVNSYGADLIQHANVILEGAQRPIGSKRCYRFAKSDLASLQHDNNRTMKQWNNVKPVFVKHLGRYRIPTLFPYLLEDVANLGFDKVDFISSNPWDFSDELINVIARNKNITRTIHLPVQSGDTNVLKRMNRWYTRDEYLKLVTNLKFKISNLKLTTDIIVGFCGETEEEFQHTVDLCKKVGFQVAYISQYSPRFGTAATKTMKDDVPHAVKEKRWRILENLVNKPHLKHK